MSFGNSPRLHARTTVATSSTVGGKLPPAAVAATDQLQRVVERVQSLHPGQDAPGVAVLAALDAGWDPAAGDEGVTRAFIAAQLANPGLGTEVPAIAQEQMATVFREHADALVHAWRAPFDKAAVALSAAHAALDRIALTDTATVVARGGSAAAQWPKAQAASNTVELINAAWLALGELSRPAPADPTYPVLRYADVPRGAGPRCRARRRSGGGRRAGPG